MKLAKVGELFFQNGWLYRKVSNTMAVRAVLHDTYVVGQ